MKLTFLPNPVFKVESPGSCATNLVGESVWIDLYKNEDGYSRVLQRVAPIEFDGKLDKFSESDVLYWKGRAEQYFKQWVEPNIGSAVMEQNDDSPF